MKYNKPETIEDVKNLQWKLSHLENQLNGEMDDYQFELRSEINEIKTILTNYQNESVPQKPNDSQFECFNCGS